MLSLRLRDGVPNPVPRHRWTGDCKYAAYYLDDGACDWCAALEARGGLDTPAEPNPNVIIRPFRFQHSDEDSARLHRIA